jgi:hypothetical protein
VKVTSLSKRRFLRRVATVVCGLALLPPALVFGRTASGRRGQVELSRADRALAALGRRLGIDRPHEARRLLRWAAARTAPWRLAGRPDAACIRQGLLDPQRLAHEFASGQVLELDGWVVARSEAAAAVALNALAEGGTTRG